MAEVFKKLVSCLVKLRRFRTLATGVFLWILVVNLVLAVVWLQPHDRTRTSYILEQNKLLYRKDKENTTVEYKRNTTTAKLQRDLLRNHGILPSTHGRYYIDFENVKKPSDALFDVIDSKTSGIPQSNASFVFVVPRRLETYTLDSLSTADHSSVLLSGQILLALNDLDGIACLPRKLNTLLQNQHSKQQEVWKGFFNKTWCNYARKDWSIHIRNSGKLELLTFKTAGGIIDHNFLQMCNIVNGPFVLRKETFAKLKGLHTNFGRITLLELFLRSEGALKIGKFGGCSYSDNLFQPDRGALHGIHDFPEYSDFGVAHGVLRIIMEDRIEWTKCVANDKLCKEEPYVPPSSLPEVGKPICCSVVLTQMLQAIVAVFTKLDIKYRLLYGTLLGAVRSGAIIPYTHDVDLAVDDRYGLNWDNYDTLQVHFGDNYSISSNSFMGMPRLLPLLPPYINIDTAPFFDGELDLEGKGFFSEKITESVKGLLPFSRSNWRTRGYTDFYRGWDVWWNGSSLVSIDGYNYTAMKEKEYESELWYGKNWRKPILTHYESQDDTGAV